MGCRSSQRDPTIDRDVFNKEIKRVWLLSLIKPPPLASSCHLLQQSVSGLLGSCWESWLWPPLNAYRTAEVVSVPPASNARTEAQTAHRHSWGHRCDSQVCLTSTLWFIHNWVAKLNSQTCTHTHTCTHTTHIRAHAHMHTPHRQRAKMEFQDLHCAGSWWLAVAFPTPNGWHFAVGALKASSSGSALLWK